MANFTLSWKKTKRNLYFLTISDTINPGDEPDKLLLSLSEAYETIAEYAEISEEDYKG